MTDLREATPGESLWLWRRRRGLTMDAAARLAGVNRQRTWQPAERDEKPPPPGRRRALPRTFSEKLALARRRAAFPLWEAAARFGCSRPTYLAMERAGDLRLVTWWEGRGYVF